MASHPLDLESHLSEPTPELIQLDWTELLTPISSAAPSGPNLEYSPEFAELELLARGTPDQHMGASLVPGRAPELGAVLQRGAALLRRTKDVRILVHVLAACVPVLGLTSFVAGLGALHELLGRFWDTVYPELDTEDDEHATARANATMASASPELVLALRRAPLLHSRSGEPISLELALLALRDAGGESNPASSSARVLSALREQPPDELAALLGTLQAGLARTAAITSLFSARSAALPNLQALQAFFSDALCVLRQHRGPEASSAPLAPVAPAPASAADCSRSATTPRNSITSRDDVREALEAICTYYRNHEPASPLPLLLGRCQRLVGLDFLATLRELAPEAVDTVVLISGAAHST